VNWLKRIFGFKKYTDKLENSDKNVPIKDSDKEADTEELFLVDSRTLNESDIGEMKWNTIHNNEILKFSDNGCVAEWEADQPRYKGKHLPSWVPASTKLKLHSGRFLLDFEIEEMAERQIGLGFMLDWSIGADWGFFGYLGSSTSAWSYDPSTGDIVCNTESISGSLPKFTNGRSGTISIDINVPRDDKCWAQFIVNGQSTPKIKLPPNSVVLPAACFLKQSQRIKMVNFNRV
jgi:hypothetical protein